jgi:hypothetical protein
VKFKAGQSGNPSGRPRGIADSRHRLRAALDPHADALLAQAVAMAKAGDGPMLAFLLSRALPAVKPESAPVSIDIAGGATLTERAEAIAAAAMAGTVPASVAGELLAGLGTLAKLRESDEIEQRIAALEERLQATEGPA